MDTSFWKSHNIEHYYGDYARRLFLAVAVLIVVSIPLFGDLLPFGTFFQIASAILLVVLAGLTTPNSKNIFLYNTIVSAIGVLLFEWAAIHYYSLQSPILFWVRELTTLALIFILYYSIKTYRSAVDGKIHPPKEEWETKLPQ